jgi:hypothetical protein
MLKIDDKALSYVQGKNLCFVVRTKDTSITCDCADVNTIVKSLKIIVLFETEVLDKDRYDIYEDQGVKVFVLKNLKVDGDINLYQKGKMLFMEPKFGIKGITA